MSNVELYYLDYCPFCHKLKGFLEEKKVNFKLVDVTNDLKLKEEIKSKTGHQTFPQLIIGGEFIGDCSSTIENFQKLKEEYKL